MAKKLSEAELLKNIPHPAFFVANGVITKVNRKASLLNLKEGTAIDSILRTGFDEYQTFTDGRICLTLLVDYLLYDASVVKYHDRDLFFLEDEFQNHDLTMLGAAIDPLMDPLHCAMLSLETLKLDPKFKDNPDLTAFTHHFYRVYGLASDMCEASLLGSMKTSKMGNYELKTEIQRIITRADSLLREAKLRIDYTCDIEDDFYGYVDIEKIERAILALTSDLFRFNKPNGKVRVKLEKERNRILLAVRCKLPDDQREYLENMLLSCHIKKDGLNLKKGGGFNGAIMARNLIAAHFGTMIIDIPRARQIRFTFSIPIKHAGLVKLQSPVPAFQESTGGYDRYLLAYAEHLPDKLYD